MEIRWLRSRKRLFAESVTELFRAFPSGSVGTQHRLDVPPRVHAVKALFPVIERRHLTDDGVEFDLPRAQHRHDPLPVLERVAEAALQAYGLLHQQVEGKIQGLRTPTNLGDVPSRPND